MRTRNLSRQCLSLIELDQPVDPTNRAGDVRVRMVHRAIAFVHALRLHLRSQSDDALLQRLAARAGLVSRGHHPVQRGRGDHAGAGPRLAPVPARGAHRSPPGGGIDTTLSAMTASAASCERIRNTPVPFSYTCCCTARLTSIAFLLPFGLVDTTGFMTPFVVAIVAYTFFGLDALGDEIEEPFGLESNDHRWTPPVPGPSKSTCVSPWVKLICPPLLPVDYLLT